MGDGSALNYVSPVLPLGGACYNGQAATRTSVWRLGLMENLLILVLALLLDLILGDPPTPVHPVGWMGKLISLLEKAAPRGSGRAELLYGIGMVIVGVAIVVVPVWFLLAFLEDSSRVGFVIVAALLLKSTFSITGLRRSALRVRRALLSGNLAVARARMPALVSRNADNMDESEVVAATVESVAENTSDGFVAPLFFFLLLGVPGALAYRMINTFDSMVGYRGRYERLGKFSARLDDAMNFVPARLTGLLMVMAAFLVGKDASGAWHMMRRDHSKTESPNAGWPMSAAAGALALQLEKAGHYRLGSGSAELNVGTIDSILILMYLVVFVWMLICFGIEGVRFVITS